MKPEPHPCRACGKPDAWYWCCVACDARWRDARTAGIREFISGERAKNGLPPRDEFWDPLVGGTA